MSQIITKPIKYIPSLVSRNNERAISIGKIIDTIVKEYNKENISSSSINIVNKIYTKERINNFCDN